METKEIQPSAEASHRTQDADTHRFRAWRSTFWQFIRYCVVGGVNTGLDVLTLNILLLGLPTNNVQVLVAYNSIAYTSGAVSSFLLNKYWTFGHKRRTTRRELVRFAITLALEVLYSNALVWLAGKILQPRIAQQSHLLFLGLPVEYILWGNASKLVAMVGGVIISYLFMRFWTFAKGKDDEAKRGGGSGPSGRERE
jgi:putative flippase GtrA